MTTFCDYHPTKTAIWGCDRCDANYCEECVTKRVVDQYGTKKVFHLCPQCNLDMEKLDVSQILPPFWNRLPLFFVYPFRFWAIIFIISFSFLSVILNRPSFIMLMIRFALWGVLLKYSHAALKYTAKGHLKPPKIDLKTISDDFNIVFKQIGIFIVAGIAFVFVLKNLGIIIGLTFLAFALLSIPAMIIMLVTTDSLIAALNPMLFVRMAVRIGWGYLLMYFFLLLLGTAPGLLNYYVLSSLPAGGQAFFSAMVECYYAIISYHLMGYVLLQYHDEIGYQVELDDEEIESKKPDAKIDKEEELLNRVNIFVKEGRIDDAITLVKADAGGVIKNLELSEKYYNLLKTRELISDMLKHGKQYLDRLVKDDNHKGKLCEVYHECYSKNSSFEPTHSTLFKIASCLGEKGNHKEAIEIYNRFTKSNPDSPMTPKAYFLAANIFNEKLKNPQKAATIFRGLIKKYPGHEIIPYVKKNLSQITT